MRIRLEKMSKFQAWYCLSSNDFYEQAIGMAMCTTIGCSHHLHNHQQIVKIKVEPLVTIEVTTTCGMLVGCLSLWPSSTTTLGLKSMIEKRSKKNMTRDIVIVVIVFISVSMFANQNWASTTLVKRNLEREL